MKDLIQIHEEQLAKDLSQVVSLVVKFIQEIERSANRAFENMGKAFVDQIFRRLQSLIYRGRTRLKTKIAIKQILRLKKNDRRPAITILA